MQRAANSEQRAPLIEYWSLHVVRCSLFNIPKPPIPLTPPAPLPPPYYHPPVPNALFARLPPHVRGVLLAVAASAAFASMHVTVRYLTSDIHPFEVAFFRNAFALLFLAPWLLSLERESLVTKRIGLHILRAVFNSIAMLTWYVALSILPVADAVSLTLIGPVFVALGAMWFLGESVTRRRWLGIFIATSGAAVIIRPGFESVGIGTVLVLVSTATVSVSRLVAKNLSRTDRTPTIVGYLSLFMTPMTLIPAIPVWTWPTLNQFGLLAMVGGLGTLAHVLYIRGYKAADVSRVEPAMFMRVVWAALLGLVVFAEFPDVWTWIGAAIVVSGTTYIARKEPVRSEHAGESLP